MHPPRYLADGSAQWSCRRPGGVFSRPFLRPGPSPGSLSTASWQPRRAQRSPLSGPGGPGAGPSLPRCRGIEPVDQHPQAPAVFDPRAHGRARRHVRRPVNGARAVAFASARGPGPAGPLVAVAARPYPRPGPRPGHQLDGGALRGQPRAPCPVARLEAGDQDACGQPVPPPSTRAAWVSSPRRGPPSTPACSNGSRTGRPPAS